jgi:hypothetical protein
MDATDLMALELKNPKAADVFTPDELKLLLQTVDTSTYAGALSELVAGIRAKLQGREPQEPQLKEVT